MKSALNFIGQIKNLIPIRDSINKENFENAGTYNGFKQYVDRNGLMIVVECPVIDTNYHTFAIDSEGIVRAYYWEGCFTEEYYTWKGAWD